MIAPFIVTVGFEFSHPGYRFSAYSLEEAEEIALVESPGGVETTNDKVIGIYSLVREVN